MTQSGTDEGPGQTWIGYFVPTALFISLSVVEGQFPQYYVSLYIVKILLVSASLFIYRSMLRDFHPEWRTLAPALLAGLFIFSIWIPLDSVTPYHLMSGGRSAYDPWKAIPDSNLRLLFLGVRFFGLVIMVPVIEELFWRSFLLRYLSEPDKDFSKVPMGKFTWSAFWIVSVAFAAGHPEWLSALVCGLVYALLLRGTRSLFAVLVAHSVTNLALGIFIVQHHAWKYW